MCSKNSCSSPHSILNLIILSICVIKKIIYIGMTHKKVGKKNLRITSFLLGDLFDKIQTLFFFFFK